ncbi:MAG: response regulator [Pseudolabrys sp.]|jgi:CheY-like chemotaxis protein/nitrogen-specific signal transduction histidine kinase
MVRRKKAVSKAKKKPVWRARKKARKPPPLPPARAIEAALAGIAHDIRTPLTGIVALAELLAASDLGQRERDWANAVKSGADHLAQLATLIVDAVRADAKGLVLRDEPFSPRELAEAVGQALSARAGNKSIAAETVIAKDLPAMASGDALRLRAALENLADNAVKFTREGSVTFKAGVESAARGRLRLVFAFADTGIGLVAADVKRLFKPFAQANEEVARRYGGAGLGLVFVKRIAKVMGGDLTVTSALGKGSTFKLTALVKPLKSSNRDAATGALAAPGRSLSILCAEDNPYGRVVMNTILRELGHRADFVESGEAAVKAAARGGYDAVLMDITLPGIDGPEATRRIRALDGAAKYMPIVGISGRSTAADETRAKEAGMDFYLVKPVSPSQLIQALARVSLRRSAR